MAQWKSSVSLGTHVEQFNMNKVTLPELVLAIREEFRQNPFYANPDVRHAVEALADMHLPAKTRGAGLEINSEERAAYREILGEVELRLQRLERICARDNRIYISRVLRHFEIDGNVWRDAGSHLTTVVNTYHEAPSQMLTMELFKAYPPGG